MERRKTLLISVAALLILAIPAISLADSGRGHDPPPTIDTIAFLGRGIASLPSDPTNFMLVKAGAGRIKVTLNGTETKVKIGVLFLDDTKYLIKDVLIDNGSVSGTIYQNDTEKGSFSVKSVIKANTEIWAGTLSLDGTAYNIYILGGHRYIKPAELKDKVSEYCSGNKTDRNCGGKIEDFCQSNPTDNRCLALFKAYCLGGNNMDDSRCREYMMTWCKDRNETEECRSFAIERTGAYCASHGETGVCHAIEQKINNFTWHGENYCAENSNTTACRYFCKKFPSKCVVTNQTEEPEEPETPEPSESELACTNSGGTVGNASCCTSASDFPNTCAIGACGCSAENSEETQVCNCAEGKCFNGTACIAVEVEPEPEPEPTEAELACTESGGTLANASCCTSANDFPNTCLIGACGCSTENSHEVQACECGEGKCYNGTACVTVEAEPEPPELELACTGSGGTPINASCCISSSDFPDTCAIGACGCSGEDSKNVTSCDCGQGMCFNGTACVTTGNQGGQ